jgi:hypothetical protein
MNQPCFNQALLCARVKDLDGLKRALEQFPPATQGPRNFYVSSVVTIAMSEGWAQGLDAVLSIKPTTFPASNEFPNASIRDALPALMKYNEHSNMKLEDTLGVLAKHAGNMAPTLKADLAFEVGPYIPEQLYVRCRSVGLLDASKTTSVSHRLTGAGQSNTAHPERVATFIAEMPAETKAKLYNAYFTNDKVVKTFSTSFLAGVLNDPAFFEDKNVNEKKFKIDKEFINDPDFSAVLINKGLLDQDRAFTAFWRNPGHVKLANELVANLNKGTSGSLDVQKNEGWLRLVSDSLLSSTDATTRLNAVKVFNQLKTNLGLPIQDNQLSHKIA